MAISTRIIKGRIKSIGNTRKITRAMELVSAAKMRRAVAGALQSRAYAQVAMEIAGRLAPKVDPQLHPMLCPAPTATRTVVVVISSNRGLAGAFSSNIANAALQQLQINKDVEFVTFGRRGADALRRAQASIVADFPKMDLAKSVTEVRPLVKLVRDGFIAGRYREVRVVYTKYVSALVQKAQAVSLLPFGNIASGNTSSPITYNLSPITSADEYIFEPSPNAILSDLLPRIVELQLWQMILESDASEHSARMLAMRNATEAAGDMIFDLTLSFNQARQAGITREIAEISAGRAAVES